MCKIKDIYVQKKSIEIILVSGYGKGEKKWCLLTNEN
jgi:hypothetical protein